MRSFSSAVFTVGAGAAVFLTMGLSVLSGVLFALACGIFAVAVSQI